MEYEFNQLQQLLNQISQLQEELAIADEILESVFEDDDLNLMEEEKKWIQKAIKKEGALHKSLKVKKGEKIPAKKLEAASHKGGKLGKRARLAMTLRKLSHHKKALKEAVTTAADEHQALTTALKANASRMHPEELKKVKSRLAQLEAEMGGKQNYHTNTIEGEY
jgi:hypothetical protein